MDPSLLSSLTVSEIVSAVPNGTFSHAEQRCRRKLEHALSSLPSEYVNILIDVALAKTQCNADEQHVLTSGEVTGLS